MTRSEYGSKDEGPSCKSGKWWALTESDKTPLLPNQPGGSNPPTFYEKLVAAGPSTADRRGVLETAVLEKNRGGPDPGDPIPQPAPHANQKRKTAEDGDDTMYSPMHSRQKESITASPLHDGPGSAKVPKPPTVAKTEWSWNSLQESWESLHIGEGHGHQHSREVSHMKQCDELFETIGIVNFRLSSHHHHASNYDDR
jgi:hypothetical protein